MNVVAFLASGIAAAVPELLVEPWPGFGVHGPRNAVDEVVKGARMHP